jgi:hypothetical protein
MGFLSAFQKRPLTDAAQSIEKFSGLLSTFLDKAAAGSPRERSITLIARSPAMPAVRALVLRAGDIQRQQIAVHVVFAKLAPLDQLAQLAAGLQLVDPRQGKSGRIRFIKNAALLDAHEQLVLGSSLCWTGDMLRRCDENRNRLDIVEEGQAGPIRLAELSFNAIWSAAKPVPSRALSGRPLAQAYASLSPAFAAAGLAGDRLPPYIPGAPVLTRH